ncbi:uncharacterized protein MONBRDRAFT_37880 [Monosiga brevicollis MX1]|uniref:Uncharacterized protein n=1 Tax=Monosiga brevicollis TaxID=81824 RepID=A9V4E1_MONBE|nr:uncharacterized protein MONBRDRAFT_37880 [Monosiga brevicollis MX1]EDQ87694.1 predicted protein [Monosiga brevicollis MX1]|eukprot:XP_001747614.1 hypothetical protein [Monosiga brevicollis MX1]
MANAHRRHSRRSSSSSLRRSPARWQPSQRPKLSLVLRISRALETLMVQGILPQLQRKVAELEDTVATARKGKSSFKLLKLWGSKATSAASDAGLGGSVYGMLSTEAQQRRLADLTFFLQNYKSAASHYSQLRKDFNNDKATRHAASASEMFAVCMSFVDVPTADQTYFDKALAAFLPEKGLGAYAMRLVLTYTHVLQSRRQYSEAVAELYIKQHPSAHRKAAFNFIQAGHCYAGAAASSLALRCLLSGWHMIKNKRWGLVEARLLTTMARQTAYLNHFSTTAAGERAVAVPLPPEGIAAGAELVVRCWVTLDSPGDHCLSLMAGYAGAQPAAELPFRTSRLAERIVVQPSLHVEAGLALHGQEEAQGFLTLRLRSHLANTATIRRFCLVNTDWALTPSSQGNLPSEVTADSHPLVTLPCVRASAQRQSLDAVLADEADSAVLAAECNRRMPNQEPFVLIIWSDSHAQVERAVTTCPLTSWDQGVALNEAVHVVLDYESVVVHDFSVDRFVPVAFPSLPSWSSGMNIVKGLSFGCSLLNGTERPGILNEKLYESQIKAAVKRFPHVDSLKPADGFVSQHREELGRTLASHYYTMVDLLEFQALNTELTTKFLDVITSYVACLLMLSRLEERKNIASCFTTVCELERKAPEPSFPRLARFLMEFDAPLKLLPTIFAPYEKILAQALHSMSKHIAMHYRDAAAYRKDHVLSVSNKPANVPHELLADEVFQLVAVALGDSYVFTLQGTQTIDIHAAYEQLIGFLKEGKKMAKVKTACHELINTVVAKSPSFHADRRTFLRSAMHQLLSIFREQPGLMGPQGLQLTTKEQEIVRGFIDTAFMMSEGGKPDLSGFQLDWLRLQASLSGKATRHPLIKHAPIASALNLATFHSYLAEDVGMETFVREAALPGQIYYYPRFFQNAFTDCLKSASQARFALSFAQICDGFIDNGTGFMPDGQRELSNKAFEMAYGCLDKMAACAAQTLGQIADVHIRMAEKTFISAIRGVENFVSMDVSSLFSRLLLEQSILDEHRTTLAGVYVKFYCDMIFSHGNNGRIVNSASRHMLISMSGSSGFKAEDYTDARELQALCRLVGPFGIKQLNDRMLGRAANAIGDLKVIVGKNGKLVELVQHCERATASEDVLRSLQDLEAFTSTLCFLGLVLDFRKYMLAALEVVLKDRIPFVYSAIAELNMQIRASSVQLLALTAGIDMQVDPQLELVLHSSRSGGSDQEYQFWITFMAMCAASVRHIGSASSGFAFKANVDAFENNAMGAATAISALSAAAFKTVAQQGMERQTIQIGQLMLLRIASTLLLRQMAGGDTRKNHRVGLAILNTIVESSPFVTADQLEKYLPYTLVRAANNTLFTRGASVTMFETE